MRHRVIRSNDCVGEAINVSHRNPAGQRNANSRRASRDSRRTNRFGRKTVGLQLRCHVQRRLVGAKENRDDVRRA